MTAAPHALMLLLGLALTACATPREQTAPGTQPPRAERPTYTLGQKWILNDGVYELIRIENDRYVFAAGPGRQINLTKDLGVAKVQRGQQVTEFDPPLSPTWPLEVGKFHVTKGFLLSQTVPRGAAGTITSAVEAYEEVQLPAGRFKAFRISLEIYNPAVKDARPAIRTWYAPELRQVVKIEGQGILGFPDLQVVAIDRPLPAPLQVALTEPKDQARTAGNRVTLSGKVTGGAGVSRVTVTLNGQEVVRQEEKGPPKSEVPLDVPLTLQEGRNVLLVTAADPEGTTREEARVIYYDKPAAPRTPTAPLAVITAPAPPPPRPCALP